MENVKFILSMLGNLLVAVACGVAWLVLKVISLVIYLMSFVLAAASVLIGGIAKLVGTLVFGAAAIMWVMNGFSADILILFAISVVLVSARLWLEKLAFACSSISATM